MPELPEVETVMRGMAGRLLGQVIAHAELRRADLRRAVPPDLARVVTGARVIGFRRRAKYILMRLAGGQSVLWHLGMSGRIVLSPPGTNAPEPAHCHLVLVTEAGWRVGFIDPRRFGLVDLVPSAAEEAHPLLAGLGPEPLEDGFTPARLAASLALRRSPIKTVLLDQRVVAGLGNIYVAEALFRARLHPARPAGEIPRGGVARLVAAIRETLGEAIAAGGSSLRDYVRPEGELGYFQHAWRVYGRAGAPCPDCPGAARCAGVRRFVQAGRSSFYCPRRQR